VREGDLVKQGQILIRVGRSRIAETGLEAAREELRRQESEFRRVEQLVKSGSLPGEQADVARSNLKRAEAQVAAMETGADDYVLEAPWAGVVSRVWISEGNYVSPRAQLVEIYDPASLIVRVPVPEQQALVVHTGQVVQVSLDAYPGRRFTGTLNRVYPELERTTRTLTAEVSLQDDARLLSGMFARVDVPIRQVTQAVVVPESALLVLPNGASIAYVLDGEKAVRRTVVTALEADGLVAVASGIAAGEQVVVRGHDALKDGAAVQVMGRKPPEAGAPKPGTSNEKTGKGKPAS
jgi:membrane fusion protein (multidrug efflux system)